MGISSRFVKKNNILKILDKAGKKQRDLESAAGLSYSRINSIINGRIENDLRRGTLWSIVRGLEKITERKIEFSEVFPEVPVELIHT